MSIADVIGSWYQRNAEHLMLTRIPPSDPAGAEALVPQESYFRIAMAEAFLAHDRKWFTDHHLAVHTTVRVEAAGAARAFTSVARPPEEALAVGAYGNYPATPLMPYHGGTVSLTAGLAVLKGRNALAAGFEILGDFSQLVGPPLSEVVKLSEALADGVQKLLAIEEGQTVLGLHQSFVSEGGAAAEMTPGYWAVINTNQGSLDPNALEVVDEHLCVRSGDAATRLTGRDYMMFRIEGRVERDDWDFQNFEELYNKALDAHFREDASGYQAYRNTLLSEVLRSADLTRTDRVRVARAYKAHLAVATSEGPGVVADQPPTVAQIVKAYAPDRDTVADQAGMTLDELLALAE